MPSVYKCHALLDVQTMALDSKNYSIRLALPSTTTSHLSSTFPVRPRQFDLMDEDIQIIKGAVLAIKSSLSALKAAHPWSKCPVKGIFRRFKVSEDSEGGSLIEMRAIRRRHATVAPTWRYATWNDLPLEIVALIFSCKRFGPLHIYSSFNCYRASTVVLDSPFEVLSSPVKIALRSLPLIQRRSFELGQITLCQNVALSTQPQARLWLRKRENTDRSNIWSRLRYNKSNSGPSPLPVVAPHAKVERLLLLESLQTPLRPNLVERWLSTPLSISRHCPDEELLSPTKQILYFLLFPLATCMLPLSICSTLFQYLSVSLNTSGPRRMSYFRDATSTLSNHVDVFVFGLGSIALLPGTALVMAYEPVRAGLVRSYLNLTKDRQIDILISIGDYTTISWPIMTNLRELYCAGATEDLFDHLDSMAPQLVCIHIEYFRCKFLFFTSCHILA